MEVGDLNTEDPFELESRRQKGKRVKRTDETKSSWLIECVTRQSIEGEPRKFRWHEMESRDALTIAIGL